MPKVSVTVRREVQGDHAAVHRINRLAFDREAEAELVDTLRIAASPFVSLVAVMGEEVIGHIFFSPVTLEPPVGKARGMGLAPMAVHPDYQRRGVGSMLVRDGLAACEKLGFGFVVVLGHPEYYPRFGFVPASSKGLLCEYDAPDEAFMVIEFRSGLFGNTRSVVKYHAAFGKV